MKLKDIAEKLGVSVVTVSNALAGKKGVSDSVRNEVMAAAREMGYDVAKYEKKENEGMKLGVIVSEMYLEVGASFYWNMYQQVVYAASKRNGFTMFEILEKNITDKSELPKVLMEGGIDGLLIIGWVKEGYIQRILAAAKVPVVLLDFYNPKFACDAVMSNNYIGMYKVTRYLLERGHRNIAFVGSRKANDNICDRYYGFRKGMEEWGIPVNEEWIIEDRNIENGDLHIDLPEYMPTAFVCNSDLTASRVYDKLKEQGYQVPEDISIAAYDNYLYGHSFAKELTTYNVDMESMAKAAVDILLKKIKKKNKHQGVRYIDSVIVERKSVKSLI